MSVPFEKLGDKQKKLVRHERGPILVLAGPGTGKTEILTHRVAYLITQKKIHPNELLAITFSRKATTEMIERLKKFSGLEQEELNVSTLHAKSLDFLQRMGKGRRFLVADDESRWLLQDAIEDLGFQCDWKTRRTFEENIKLSKARNQLPDEVTEPDLQKVYRRYEELLDYNDAVDLDGLILKVVRASNSGNDKLSSISFKGHLLVDEYQDINLTEYELIRILAEKATSLFVVGDDDQSIYGWRGANPQIIRNFQRDFKSGQIEILERSYRCSEKILNGAYAIVANDPECIKKSLHSAKGVGIPIHILLSKSWTVEALWIVDWIKKYLSQKSRKPSDIVILAKSLSIANFLAEQMRLAKIPATFWRSGGLLTDKDVIDILTSIRLILESEDNLAFRRCLKTDMAKGIGDVAIRRLRKLGEKHKACLWEMASNAKQFVELKRWRSHLGDFIASMTALKTEVVGLEPYEAVGLISKRLGVNQRVNVKRLLNFAKSLAEGSTIKDILREINKIRGVDLIGGGPEPETKEEAVAIMSMHSAKGLGYKKVFILGMDKGIMPDRNQDECEQRRLCYVAMTRAKEELFLCHSKLRKGPAARGYSFYKISKFLTEIPKECRDVINNEYT